jgi:hypothetical protein
LKVGLSEAYRCFGIKLAVNDVGDPEIQKSKHCKDRT